MYPLKTVRISVSFILKILIGLGIVALVVWYGLFQARVFIAGPQLLLEQPNHYSFDERIITVVGNAENITNITLNGRNINTTESGDFEEQLVLQNGYTIMTLQAEDRYGRTTTLTRSFIYTPS